MDKATNDTIIGRGWGFPLDVNRRGGITLTREHSEIEEAVIIILSTPIGARVMRPTFGSRLHELVFAPDNNQTRADARRFVEEALAMWEPRIRVKDVEVRSNPDEEQPGLLIHIQYEIKATHDPRSLVHPFYLIPGESA